MIYKWFKRSFDFIAAFLLFVVISPFFLVLCLVVWIKLGRPIFFNQIRTTMSMKSFGLIKFRTMTNERDEQGKLLPDEKRLTPFGHFLRNTSLDELPELLNIIKGDMAVIGPRPLYPRYNEFYKEEEKKRFDVRGGLIPPESIHHDSFLTWDKQLKYEADYANNLCLGLDCKILMSVFKTMINRKKTDYGAYNRGGLDVERKNMKG